MQENTCCFFGHRTINETEELKTKLYEVVEKLIIENKVDTFLFGSKSRFNDLCLDIVTKICDGIIILEHVIELDLAEYNILKQKKYGDKYITFLSVK